MSNFLLHKIELKTGETMIGIVDYVSTKQLFFFDFTNDYTLDDDLLILAMMWRGNSPDTTRFSVYCAMYFPTLQLPTAKLIPLSNIDQCDVSLTPTPKPKSRRRKIRSVALTSAPRKRRLVQQAQ
jgi:hypothetical protein